MLSWCLANFEFLHLIFPYPRSWTKVLKTKGSCFLLKVFRKWQIFFSRLDIYFCFLFRKSNFAKQIYSQNGTKSIAIQHSNFIRYLFNLYKSNVWKKTLNLNGRYSIWRKPISHDDVSSDAHSILNGPRPSSFWFQRESLSARKMRRILKFIISMKYLRLIHKWRHF